MESNGSLDSASSRKSVLRLPSRTTSPSPTGRKKRRSTPKRKGNPATLPLNVSKHVASFLHPVDTVALRQTSKAFRDAVERYPTKQNALQHFAGYRNNPNAPHSLYWQQVRSYPATQNRLIMVTSGRRYMKHDEARKYLEKMFTHK